MLGKAEKHALDVFFKVVATKVIHDLALKTSLQALSRLTTLGRLRGPGKLPFCPYPSGRAMVASGSRRTVCSAK